MPLKKILEYYFSLTLQTCFWLVTKLLIFLKPARGVQTDGQNSRLPAYNETPVHADI